MSDVQTRQPKARSVGRAMAYHVWPVRRWNDYHQLWEVGYEGKRFLPGNPEQNLCIFVSTILVDAEDGKDAKREDLDEAVRMEALRENLTLTRIQVSLNE